MNNVTVRLKGPEHWYIYVRYMFFKKDELTSQV